VSIFDRHELPPNPYLKWALGGSFALQALTLVVPGLRSLLGITPIGLLDGLVIGSSAVLPYIVNEATKAKITVISPQRLRGTEEITEEESESAQQMESDRG
jgi:Ca2+-transporting ATPase